VALPTARPDHLVALLLLLLLLLLLHGFSRRGWPLPPPAAFCCSCVFCPCHGC